MANPALNGKSFLAAVLVWAAWGPAARAAEFTLVTPEAFPSASTPTVRVTGRHVPRLLFRLYRIEDLEAFLKSPASVEVNPSDPQGGPASSPATSNPEAGRPGLKRRLPQELRARARDWLGLGWAPPFTRGRRPSSPAFLQGFPLVRAWTRVLAPSWGGWVYQDVPVTVPGPGAYLLEALDGRDRAWTLILSGDLAFEAKRAQDRVWAWCADRRTGLPAEGVRIVSLEAVRGAPGTRGAGGAEPAGHGPPAELAALGALERLIRARGTWNVGAAYSGGGPAVLRRLESGRTGPQGFWKGRVSEDTVLLARRGQEWALARVRAPWSKEPPWRVYLHTDRPGYRPGHKVSFKGVARKVERGEYKTVPSGVEVEIKDPRGGTVHRLELQAGTEGSFAGAWSVPEEAPLGRYALVARVGGYTETSGFEVQAYRKPEFKVQVRPEARASFLGEEASFEVRADYHFGSPVAGAQVEYVLYRVPLGPAREADPFQTEEDGAYDHYVRAVARGSGSLDEAGRLLVRLPLTPELPESEAFRGPDFRFRLWAQVTDAGRRTQSGEGSVLGRRAEFLLKLHRDQEMAGPGETVQVSVGAVDHEGRPVQAQAEVRASRVWGRALVERAAAFTGSLALPPGGAPWPLTLREPGFYRLEAESRDPSGRKVLGSTTLWVWGSGSRGVEGPGRLVLLTDRKTYKPGDTARIMVLSPGDAPVLISVEGSQVHQSLVLQPSGGQGLLELPIQEAWAPTVHLQANAFVEGRPYAASKALPVSPESKLLRVEFVPEPGRLSASGAPSAASSASGRLGPDEEVAFRVTTRDRDGRPVPAEVSVGVVDEAVYAVLPETVPSIESFFWGPRPNRVASVQSVHFWWQGRSRPGAGPPMPEDGFEAEDLKAGEADPRVRRRFEDTMLWVAQLRTGPDGTAWLRTRTPDNLTTWRATVRAATPATQVGQTTGTFVTSKDLLVRLQVPRFYVRGDEAVLSAVVHNRLADPRQVRVELSVAGAGLVPLEGLGPSSGTAPGEGTWRRDWRVRAESAGKVRLSVRAYSGELSDAVELEVPVLEHGYRKAESVSGEAREASRSALTLPATAEPGSARLTLHLTASPGQALIQALPGLMEYPYGCVEQTMSRFGPTLAAARAFRELGLPRDGLPKDLDKMVEAGVGRLLNFQHGDGGWGWWEADATDPFMTAYALWGLLQAKEEGRPVDAGALERGRRSLAAQLAGPPGSGPQADEERAFMTFVLSRMPEAAAEAAAYVSGLARDPAASDQSKALLALAFEGLGRGNEARGLLASLERTADRAGGTARWKGEGYEHGWGHPDTVQTTALALRAFVKADPSNPIAGQALGGLLGGRRGSSWHSTKDTAAVAYALVDYLKRTGTGGGPVRARVLLDGREVLNEELDPRLPQGAARTLAAGTLGPGTHVVEVRREGKGELFYTATLSYLERGEDLPPQDAARFKVRRSHSRLVPEVRPGGLWGWSRRDLKGLRPGDHVLVEVEVEASDDQEQFMLEDPFPSGFEWTQALDSAQVGEWGTSWRGSPYDGREVKDDRVALFASRLRAGRHVWRHVLRAEAPGRLHVLPAAAQLAYFPDIRASSQEGRLEVGE